MPPCSLRHFLIVFRLVGSHGWWDCGTVLLVQCFIYDSAIIQCHLHRMKEQKEQDLKLQASQQRWSLIMLLSTWREQLVGMKFLWPLLSISFNTYFLKFKQSARGHFVRLKLQSPSIELRAFLDISNQRLTLPVLWSVQDRVCFLQCWLKGRLVWPSNGFE